ncbi:DUF4492 domain-containing protein [Labilibaculum euxinus]|uniref:DUF4492 domain-containing protein n=1 Tax=Labilibaculum euxinus TaxID=2686357 RepID=A0A7M4D1F7_9BACT|nr:DUF4492 domain-containing protein [Labilibaculum euxinus]MUP36486.1 DUF4492 domain-containing protein [Labilibaculum euxinus]MVB05691.1 DUF4492 domain-containing protein [Labilibaculum euxinus]
MNNVLNRLVKLPKTIWTFYYEGFRNQSKWSRQLWLIILIKLFVMFFILKLLFFPNFLKTKYDSDQERSDYVIDQLTNPKNQ